VLSLIIGVAFFETYSLACTQATTVFPQTRALIENTGISIWTLLVSVVLENIFRSAAFVVIVFASALLTGISLNFAWLALPVLFALSAPFLYAVTLTVAGLTRFFPNFPRLMGALNRVIFYSSGIFWSIDKVLADYPAALFIAHLNPIYQLTTMGRELIIDAEVSSNHALFLISTTLGLFAIGIAIFSRAQKSRYV
jgi:teichoic acid transport system permease protein